MQGYIAQKQLTGQVPETLPATAAATEGEALAKLAQVTGLGPQTVWDKLGYSVVPAEIPEQAKP